MDRLERQLNEMVFGVSKKRVAKKKSVKKKATKKKIKAKLVRKTYTHDFNDLHLKQKGWCANPGCAKINRIKQKVTTLKDLDHKFPIKLWEIMDKKGDPNNLKNLQLLCPSCHRFKTALDRKKISLYKREHGLKSVKKTKKKSSSKKEIKVKAIVDMTGRTKLIPKNQAQKRKNIITGKDEWVLK
jgi:5-methylcytosine-specific restriction endonuclease McrA